MSPPRSSSPGARFPPNLTESRRPSSRLIPGIAAGHEVVDETRAPLARITSEFALVENDDIAGVDQRSTDRADWIVRDPGHFTGRRPGGSLRDVLAGSTTGSRLSPRSCCSLGPGGPSPLSSAASIHALCLEYTNAAGIGADRHENFTRPRPDWRTSDESGERASGS